MARNVPVPGPTRPSYRPMIRPMSRDRSRVCPRVLGGFSTFPKSLAKNSTTATTGSAARTIICKTSSLRYTAAEVPREEPIRDPAAAGMAHSQSTLPETMYL